MFHRFNSVAQSFHHKKLIGIIGFNKIYEIFSIEEKGLGFIQRDSCISIRVIINYSVEPEYLSFGCKMDDSLVDVGLVFYDFYFTGLDAVYSARQVTFKKNDIIALKITA
jgi:hypothetical protein